jgi:tRNA-uridine 2-sulfurtransferase
MSGGVDSTACALLLQERYDTVGFFMHLAQADIAWQRQRVEDIAARIGIELHVIDLRRQFEEKILAYFSGSYFDGLTPNPCMLCNREIKFGLFMNTILDAGMDCMATGHYARVREMDGLSHLYKGIAPDKDQSYFLARLTQRQLGRVLFPLGDRKKEEIYALVESYGFLDFRGIESQDICFLGQEGLGSYLEKRRPAGTLPGPIVTRSGHELGHHNGLFRYTIGQRRGLGLPDTTPWYVLALEKGENKIIVGKEEDLYRDCIGIINIHWLADRPPLQETGYQVRIRYSHRGAEATVTRITDTHYKITFREKQRAVTPGQFAVIYRDDEVIGSGEILADLLQTAIDNKNLVTPVHKNGTPSVS